MRTGAKSAIRQAREERVALLTWTTLPRRPFCQSWPIQPGSPMGLVAALPRLLDPFLSEETRADLPPQELSGAPPRVLKGRDLEFFRDGDVRCSIWDATAVVLQLREAKNDQFSRGQVRTHHLTGSFICPVLALRDCTPEPALAQ